MVREGLANLSSLEKRASLHSVLLVFAFVIFTALCARVAIPLPFTPVPVTLQVLSVFLMGLMMRPMQAFSAMVVYVAGGALGVPWFAKIGGYATFGYLLGFMFAAPLCSWLRTRVGSGVACMIALVVIYAMGVSFLCFALGINALKGIVLGALPFIPVDLGKALIAIKIAEKVGTYGKA